MDNAPGAMDGQRHAMTVVQYSVIEARCRMSQRAVTQMSADEFLEWGLRQDMRYELVDGVPVAMAGARQRHDLIVTNIHGMLYALLRGKKCRCFTADLAIRIPAGNIRRPDAGIDCGVFAPDTTSVSAPLVVIEVLSPSTRDFDMFGKLEEYKTVPTLAHIVIVDPDAPQVFHWSRPQDKTWSHELLEGPETVIQLPEVAGLLDLASIYEGLTFRLLPRLEPEADTTV